MSWCDAALAALRSPCSSPANTLTAFGVLVLLITIVSALRSLWINFKAYILARYYPDQFALDLKTLGSWAVVTGASDGIGKQYAIQLACIHRLNVLLISRSIDKLKKVAEEIDASKPGVETRCLAIDFTGELDIYDKIEKELEGLDIAILVNNVGDAGDINDLIHFYKTKRTPNFWNVLRVNCGNVTFMSQMVLPRMVAKNKGVVVNMSSAAGLRSGLIFGSVYSGTKAYVLRFTRTLQVECHGTGVIFQTLTPYSVSTKMIGQEPSFFVVSAESFVKQAIASIGHLTQTPGCFMHYIMDLIVKPSALLPDSLLRKVMLVFTEKITHGRADEFDHAKQN